MSTPGQSVFGMDMLFNLASVVDWQVATAGKKRQVVIDNVKENAKRVMHDYTICNLVYEEITGIYRKLDYKKQGPYRSTKVFTNHTVGVQLGQVNKRMNIRRWNPHFDE